MTRVLWLFIVLSNGGTAASPQEVRDGYTLFPRTRMLTRDEGGRLRLQDVLLAISHDGTLIVKERASDVVYTRFTRDFIRAATFENSLNPGTWVVEDAYWLSLDFQDGGVLRNVVLRVDRGEVDAAYLTIRERMGIDARNLVGTDIAGPLIRAKGSKDVDQVVDHAIDRVASALAASLARYDCEVEKSAEVAQERGVTECRRAQFEHSSSPWGPGGEKLRARLEPVSGGKRTRVQIATDHGNRALRWNFGKMNWSTPVFAEIVSQLDSSEVRVPGVPTLFRAIGRGEVRKAPAEDADVLAGLVPGQLLERLDERGEWYLVRPPVDGTPQDWRTGWVLKTALRALADRQ